MDELSTSALSGASPDALASLLDPVFTRADALASDVPDVKLRQRGRHNVTRGVWSHEETTSWLDRAQAMALVLPPASGYSHLAAAAIHELSLPAALQHPRALDVITPTSTAQRRRPGWVGHRGAESRRVVIEKGLPVTDRLDTWIDLGALAVGRSPRLGLDDLIVMGDEVLNWVIAHQLAGSSGSPLGHAQRHLDPAVVDPALAFMHDRLMQRVRPRGKRRLTEAMRMVRAGVKSPQETRARLMFVRAGLPEPLINKNIHVDDGGGWLAEGDLVWREQRVVAEYQSEHHADRRRRSIDSDRLANLTDHDWAAHEVWAEDLRPGARQWALVQRVRASLSRHG
ncbi:MAG: hypothetical protein M9923_11290 [Phycicoccus sp.]|uniref:hypothetical protein n=1 Tax=Phycicoccus sp. TaxID=1902410 RepID=UPI00258A923D|nr:hypothetical protein [Phycicoccus sp.]MCO5303774.1 hypothetical protein [Phycicoccus sp.]